jgi:hypothetical protein
VADASSLIHASCAGLYSGFKIMNMTDILNSDADAASLYIDGGTNGVMQSVDTFVASVSLKIVIIMNDGSFVYSSVFTAET